MGGIWMPRNELAATVGEIVGIKSGLALSQPELVDSVRGEYREFLVGPSDEVIRIRSEEVEQLVADVLFAVGNIPSPSIGTISGPLIRKYRGDAGAWPVFESVFTSFTAFLGPAVESAARSGGALDPTPFLSDSAAAHGALGLQMAIEMVESLRMSLHCSPWTGYRRVEWADTAELEDLFRSESLETAYGSFIDQRYLDYLAANLDDIDKMHWRKFEALTCEYLERYGFNVEIGRGRDDDNVDARAWPKDVDPRRPPALVVQCKRQQAKVEKVVVKALWADMQHEGAKAGLIVTTSSLSPGASKTLTARGYAIEEADRRTVQRWIQAMRTPWSGVFLGG